MTMFKAMDFACDYCGAERFSELVKRWDYVICRCGKIMRRSWSRVHDEQLSNHNDFRPFWSDTFQMRVRDRIDLQKVKELRKKHGLECVGHTTQRADKKAIRINYESD